MDGRATADIIADLRRVATEGGFMEAIDLMFGAADRLAELEAEVNHWVATYERAMADWAEAERVIR